MRKTKPAGGLIALVVLVLATGCSSGRDTTYSVEGTVQVDGQLVTGGAVAFESVEPGSDGKRRTARGTIGPDGTYRLTTFTRGDGALAGRHRAMVVNTTLFDPESERPPSASVIPGRYSAFETSGLEFDVKPEPNRIDIGLEP